MYPTSPSVRGERSLLYNKAYTVTLNSFIYGPMIITQYTSTYIQYYIYITVLYISLLLKLYYALCIVYVFSKALT